MRRFLHLAVLACCLLQSVDAQTRDPTTAPAQAGLDLPPGGGVATGAGSLTPGAMALVVRDGKPMVMLGARLYAVGDKVPGGTITRIEETAVWLREAGVVRKVGLFEAVERRTSQASSPTTSASSSKKSVPSKKMRQTHAK